MTCPRAQLVGLSAAEMGGSGVTVHFKIVRSAGTLTCEGWFEGGKGSGHFHLSAESRFRRRAGQARHSTRPPDAWEQFQMTMAGVGLELVDELARRSMTAPPPRNSRGWRCTEWIWSTSGTSARGGIISGTRRAWSGCGITVWTRSSSRRWTVQANKNLGTEALVRLRITVSMRSTSRDEGDGLRAREPRGAG